MRTAINMQRMCGERKGALISIVHVLQGGKGSTVGMRGLFVGNWTKDPRWNRFASHTCQADRCGKLPYTNLHHRNDPKTAYAHTF